MKTSRERKAREELPGRTVDEVWRAAWESCCLRSGVGRDDALADYLAGGELLPGRTKAEIRADMLDHLINRYYAADKNHFALSPSTIAWLRSQAEYKARYGIEAGGE